MQDERIRSMVPMFGGSNNYVETLDQIVSYVAAAGPTHTDLIEWHRDQFARVSSAYSIERRLDYLQNVGFIERTGKHWNLAVSGVRYFNDQRTEVLFDIMAERNVGLQSLLYELSITPLLIEEVNEFLLETHDELGWDPAKTDMALQRTNWLRSMGLIERTDEVFRLTSTGQRFVDDITQIRSVWELDDLNESENQSAETTTAEAYTTTATGRYIDADFRATVLHHYHNTCPLSTVDHPQLLDVAHILPWSEYPEYRADFQNVLPLSKTHHAAFDAGLFTLDRDFRVQIHPSFETRSPLLRKSLIDREGDQLEFPDRIQVAQEFIDQHNECLEWWSA